MTKNLPLVSIGVPVYNGEAYLAEALDSLLAQSYQNLQIVICDNASTDSTQTISERYAQLDSRIEYHRNAENLGAAINYNNSFKLSKGKYFKWATHDDLCAPNMIQACVDALESDDAAALCAPKTIIIDDKGTAVKNLQRELDASHCDALSRLKQYFNFYYADEEANQVFGVYRSSLLKQSALIGNYPASDLLLLAQISLMGKIVLLDERLFMRRDHEATSIRANKTPADVARWFDASKPKNLRVYPYFRRFLEFQKIVYGSTLTLTDKLKAFALVTRWAYRQRALFKIELIAYLGMNKA